MIEIFITAFYSVNYAIFSFLLFFLMQICSYLNDVSIRRAWNLKM